MYMPELIRKKRDGGELTAEEISYIINGCVSGEVPDYQLSAFAMAVFFRGMTNAETVALTLAMRDSGDKADLSGISGVKVDKHSTGGVGDKTTLIVAPIVAACGVKVAKMSGRGLGHTGGTVDKLESIPGFRTSISPQEMRETVETCGLSVTGQSGNMCPADKKLYALRDVTAEQMANVVIAYEPIWAIGTGKTATADQAEEVCAQIRKVIGEVYGEAVAEATTVQYGGSMNAKNCEELLSKKDVDGGLIGGASLKAPDFAVIVNAATKG
mgnify:CR=1 FL=1